MKFRIVKRAWWMRWTLGMVVWPFVWFRTEQAMMNDRLFRHELEHCYQIRHLGRFKFYVSYVWLWLRHGYQNHPYEIAARAIQDQPLMPEEKHWRAQGKVWL